MSPFNVEVVGWASTAILLVTLLRQVYSEWKSKSTGGVSKWLFVGQIAASAGFTYYSVSLKNWVFAASNFAILLIALIGQWVYARNRRLGKGPG